MPSESLSQRVLATMKSRETEGKFELYVTRTPGYLWALLFKKLHVHPIAVTLMSIVIGAAAGVLFGYSQLWINAIGMLLLIWANWFDCADGQLARMTGRKTLIGRVPDGFAGDVWFFFIYAAICVRLTLQPAPWTALCEPYAQGQSLVRELISGGNWGIWIWLLCCLASTAHADQCALADYYRNIHLSVINGSAGSELDSSQRIRSRMRSLKWNSRDWFEKLYLFFYIGYTKNQERLSPEFQKLNRIIRTRLHGNLPEKLRLQFRDGSRPLMKYANFVTFDARVATLFITLLIGLPWLYPLLELTLFQGVFIYMRRRHEKLCRTIIDEIRNA